MGAPTALGNARTGTPDASNGIKIPIIDAQEDSTVDIPGGLSLSDRIPSAPSANRSAVAAADSATDMSSAGFGSAGLEAINNRGALVLWCEFANTAGSATVRVVYYDAAGAPLFVGPTLSFTPTSYRVSASGDYLSEPQIVETFGASKYKLYLVTTGTGNVDLFGQPV